LHDISQAKEGNGIPLIALSTSENEDVTDTIQLYMTGPV